jgi:hypothetical protein
LAQFFCPLFRNEETLNWGREPCLIRSKRSTDEDDDLTIDVPADIVSYEEGVEGVIFFLMKIQGNYY